MKIVSDSGQEEVKGLNAAEGIAVAGGVSPSFMGMAMDHTHTIRIVLDGVSITVAAGAVVGWLPPVASFLSIIWLTIQISEWGLKKVRVKNDLRSESTDR